ncbi:glycosyltransferase family 39 protein [Arthrobacter sp. FX8]|uniref:ArnT family glycosyltransferase n=1 Tax=Arthrobacter sp. FX8 TaxID=2997335 RepID=UPI00227B812A|nr:glycosyltransferase family 39 protein [Arthrobacter sp. FX8]WAJ31726.1 glycosyltransferase family 39 protein [Arthrobacter sp. FX8]
MTPLPLDTNASQDAHLGHVKQAPRQGRREELRRPEATQRGHARQKNWQGQEWNDRREGAALGVLLLATAVLYLWRLDANGWANPYYSAAAQAGAMDWTAWFYGSADAGNLVTVDKTPLSVWIMGLSVRLFGLSSWSILLPQTLMGVTTTWLIYKTIRTTSTPHVALLGAAVYATTPVVVLMSRFNNPEPLMGLLVVAAVYFAVKAIEDGRWRWFLLCGAALGFGFMAKQIQALLVVPSLILAVLFLGTSPLGARIMRLVGAFAVLLVTAGWWVLIVELVPASQRPYIGGSANNSALQLTMGYNGIGRFAQFTNHDGVPVPSESQSLPNTIIAGFSRLFSADFAPEAAWLLFPSLACALVLLVLRDPSSRQKTSATALIASTWLITVVGVLAMAGTMVHSYYTFSFAAPMAIVLPLGLRQLWTSRHRLVSRAIGSVVIAATGYLASKILEYSHDWPPGWQLLLPVGCFAASLLWLLPQGKTRMAILLPVALSLLMGPAVTNLYTVSTPQGGTNPLSGPPSAFDGSLSKRFEAARQGEDLRSLHLAFGAPPNPELVQLLRANTGDETWAAMTVTAQNAALYQLESRRPVAALGGWLGLDPTPTLEVFQNLVAQGHIGYFIDQPGLLAEQKVGKEAETILQWIHENFIPTKLGAETIYDLTVHQP